MNLVFPNTTEFCTRIMCIWNVFVCSGVYIHYKNFPPNISCQIRCPHIDIVLFSSIFIIIFKIHTNYPFCPYPFRCLYIGIQNSAQMSSARSGVYNITGKNKIGTRIVYNIFWLDAPVQVSILYTKLPPKCPPSVQVSIYRHIIFAIFYDIKITH